MIVKMHRSRLAVLLAVASQSRPTVPSVVLETGLARSTVHYHLRALRRDGWVFWADDMRGTLHSNYVAKALA